MTDLRNDLGISDLPVIVGQLVEWSWIKKPYISEGTRSLDDTIKDAFSFLPDSACVPSEGLRPLKSEKGPHFDADSQIILGRRYAEVAKRLLKK